MRYSEAARFLSGKECDELTCSSQSISIVPLYIDPRELPTNYIALCLVHLEEYKTTHIVALKENYANS